MPFPEHTLFPVPKNVYDIKDKPIYITLDIDVVDPAYANGTGTPEPGGISSRELLDSIHLFKEQILSDLTLWKYHPTMINLTGRRSLRQKLSEKSL